MSIGVLGASTTRLAAPRPSGGGRLTRLALVGVVGGIGGFAAAQQFSDRPGWTGALLVGAGTTALGFGAGAVTRAIVGHGGTYGRGAATALATGVATGAVIGGARLPSAARPVLPERPEIPDGPRSWEQNVEATVEPEIESRHFWRVSTGVGAGVIGAATLLFTSEAAVSGIREAGASAPPASAARALRSIGPIAAVTGAVVAATQLIPDSTDTPTPRTFSGAPLPSPEQPPSGWDALIEPTAADIADARTLTDHAASIESAAQVLAALGGVDVKDGNVGMFAEDTAALRSELVALSNELPTIEALSVGEISAVESAVAAAIEQLSHLRINPSYEFTPGAAVSAAMTAADTAGQLGANLRSHSAPAVGESVARFYGRNGDQVVDAQLSAGELPAIAPLPTLAAAIGAAEQRGGSAVILKDDDGYRPYPLNEDELPPRDTPVQAIATDNTRAEALYFDGTWYGRIESGHWIESIPGE